MSVQVRQCQATVTLRQFFPACVINSDFEPEHVVLVNPLPNSAKARAEAVLTALLDADSAPSRNGVYDCSLVPLEDGTQAVFVRWESGA